MFDGIAILLCPFLIIPFVSILIAYLIEYIRLYLSHRRQKQHEQMKYLSLIIVQSSNQSNSPPAYETLFF